MTCKDCICYGACNYHIDEETSMTVNECSTGFKHKDQYVKLPAFIGQRVWLPFVYCNNTVEILEGKVSGLQQKVDGSWKIRISRRGCVADYTIDAFNLYTYSSEEAALAFVQERGLTLK